MAVSDVSINTALNQQQKTSNATSQLASDFNQFLTLLTVQLQNQDPLSPMDTTEFTNQLVAFAGVEQQINSNQKLDSLVALQLGNAMGSALNYVGLNVSYLSSEFNYEGSGTTEVNYALDKQALESKVRIYDETGDLVFEGEASKNPGQNKFTWDGKNTAGEQLAAGTYEIKIDALDLDGNAISTSTVVKGRVKGVETQNGLIYLLVGERAVALNTVLNVATPPAATPPEDDI